MALRQESHTYTETGFCKCYLLPAETDEILINVEEHRDAACGCGLGKDAAEVRFRELKKPSPRSDTTTKAKDQALSRTSNPEP